MSFLMMVYSEGVLRDAKKRKKRLRAAASSALQRGVRKRPNNPRNPKGTLRDNKNKKI